MAYATRRSYAGAASACTLTSGITSSATSMTLTGDTTNWNNTANGPFYIVVDAGLATEEKILVTARTSGNVTAMTRGQDGTTAAAHAAGAVTYPVFTAVDADQANAVAATMTTKGDLLVTTGTVLNRLAVGTDGQALTASAAATNGVAWATVADATKVPLSTFTTKGDIVAATASGAIARTAVGTNGYSLVANSANANGVGWAQVAFGGIASRAVGSAELKELTLNAQIASYTAVLTDAQKIVTMNLGTALNFNIPTDASVNFLVGDQINILQLGAGAVTIQAVTPGTTTVSSQGGKTKTNGQYSMATAVKVAANSWVLVGNLTV